MKVKWFIALNKVHGNVTEKYLQRTNRKTPIIESIQHPSPSLTD